MTQEVVAAEYVPTTFGQAARDDVHRVGLACGHWVEVTVETYEAVVNGEASELPCPECHER